MGSTAASVEVDGREVDGREEVLREDGSDNGAAAAPGEDREEEEVGIGIKLCSVGILLLAPHHGTPCHI